MAPNSHSQLNLRRLFDMDLVAKSDAASRRNGAVDAVQDIHRLLRRASPTFRTRDRDAADPAQHHH